MVRELEITALDKLSLSRYCYLLSKCYGMKDLLEEDEYTYEVKKKDSRGNFYTCYIRERPKVPTSKSINSELMRLKKEFRLIPQAKQKSESLRSRIQKIIRISISPSIYLGETS